jgi:dephospho-CoA kinase
MGYGDFKLLAALGAWMGWQMLPLIVLLSSVVGAVVGLLLMSTGRLKRAHPMPFGPFIAAAGWIAFIWGEKSIQFYTRSGGLGCGNGDIDRRQDITERGPDIFTVVLTGGIASGKTAVSDHFRRLGVPVVDTDQIARMVVEPGKPALKQIARSFGHEFLGSDGRLNRRKMRAAIFSDPEMKSRLESILHPLIAEEVLSQISGLNAPYCVLVIPLYAESSSYGWIDRVLLVDVAQDVQIERVMARDQISREQAMVILRAQASRDERLAIADDVLDNSGSISELQQKVEMLHQEYLRMADQTKRC